MRLNFSRDLEALLKQLVEQPLTLQHILSETAERGSSLIIGLLVLPFLVPVPPGTTAVLGSGVLILSLQMAIGRRSPWLPKRVGEIQFPNWLTRNLFGALQRVSRILERVARPRLRWLAESTIAWQLNGLCISWLTTLLILPVPFTNPVPTMVILMLTVAIMEADGLLMCVGYGFTIATTLLVYQVAVRLGALLPLSGLISSGN